MRHQMMANICSEISKREEIENKFKDRILEKLDLASQVSFVGNKKIPFMRLYRYKEAFSYNFVKEFLSRFKVTKEDYVFDPFSGLGTTTFTSMLEGIPSIGIDLLPIAYFCSKTLPMFVFLHNNELTKIWKEIKPKIEKNEPAIIASDVRIIEKAFDEATLISLRKLKTTIDELPNPHRDMLLILFFSILEDCSYTLKDGQFLRINKEKTLSDPIKAMSSKVAMVEEDLNRIKFLYHDLNVEKESMPDVYIEDARDLSKVNFKKNPTVIVTSPPYPNRYDYTRSYSLELCFHFVKNFEELKALRFGILRSHIESKIQENESPPHPVLKEVIDALGYKELNNPGIPDMITTYFIDMRKAINQLYDVLHSPGKVAMVVDNVRFEGEMVPVDLVLSEMAEEVGFNVKEIIVARYKGNSSQQMKKYGRVPVRESVLIWEK